MQRDLVLVNGIGGAPAIWKPVADRLGGRLWHPPLTARSIDRLVDDLVRVLERPAVLVAWSGGAKLAELAAARAPGRVAGLCGISGAFRANAERTRRLAALADRLPDRGPLLDRVVDLIAAHAEPPTPALLADLAAREGAAFVEALFRGAPRRALAFPALRDAPSIAGYLRLVAELATVDVVDVLVRTRLPVLLIAGSADRIVGAEESRRVAAAIPGATYVELAGATHYALLERPDAIADAIVCRAWLPTRTAATRRSATTTS